MMAKSNVGKSLIEFTGDVGIPESLLTDSASEFMGRHTKFIKEAHHMQMKLHTTEQGCRNQNFTAELDA